MTHHRRRCSKISSLPIPSSGTAADRCEEVKISENSSENTQVKSNCQENHTNTKFWPRDPAPQSVTIATQSVTGSLYLPALDAPVMFTVRRNSSLFCLSKPLTSSIRFFSFLFFFSERKDQADLAERFRHQGHPWLQAGDDVFVSVEQRAMCVRTQGWTHCSPC